MNLARFLLLAVAGYAVLTAGAAASTLGPRAPDLITKPEVNWSDLKNLASCRPDAGPKKKKILVVLVGVGRTVFEGERTWKWGSANDIAALKRFFSKAYAAHDLVIHELADTTAPALRALFLSELTAKRCPDLVYFHFSGFALEENSRIVDLALGDELGRAASEFRRSFLNGICPYYLLVGERPTAISDNGEVDLRKLNLLCDVALRNAANAFRNRGTPFVASIDTNYAALADFGKSDRERVTWRRVIARGLSNDINAPLHDGAAGFVALYGANEDEVGQERSAAVDDIRGQFGVLTYALVRAVSENLYASARDLVETLNAVSQCASESDCDLIVEARDPDRPVFFPWLDKAPENARAGYELDDYVIVDEPRLVDGAASTSEQKMHVSARLKTCDRAKYRSILIDGEPTPLSSDCRFERGVRLKPGGNKVRITLIASGEEIVPLAFEVFYLDKPQFQKPGRQFALLIGNQDYQDATWRDLGTPVADVEALAGLLRDRYGFLTELPGAPAGARSLILKNATRGEILQALNLLIDTATDEDSIFIFYAGHGQLDERTQKAYWIPRDAGAADFYNWVSSDDLKATIEREDARARHVLVVADSCYAGAMWREGGTRQQSLTRAIASETEQVTHFVRLHEKRSRIAMSSGAEEPVLDGGGRGHSIFARALLDALEDDERAAFTSADIYAEYLVPRVSANTEQTPQRDPFSAAHKGGDFVFARTPR